MYAWGMIVSQLINLMDKYGHGATYKDPMGKLRQYVVGILSFVDDCNLSSARENYEKVQYVLKQTQHDVQLWNEFVRVSGAQLELDKCFT